jgi:hypothetical protein
MRAMSLLKNWLSRWPIPAVGTWVTAWLVYRFLLMQDFAPHWSWAVACAWGVVLGVVAASWWRRLFIACGFPLSWALTQSGGVLPQWPAWAWLLPLLLLFVLYPLRTWRDAPLFPTPLDALTELPQHAPLLEYASVLDAGCGLGHGLLALRKVYPTQSLCGLEWSWPLRFAAALRCPWAHVSQGDIWKANWALYDMVYVFQRPESMERAVCKANTEMREGTWLVSLDFEATSSRSNAHFVAPGGKMVWLYQVPIESSSGE